MKGMLTALRFSVGDSLRGLRKWVEIFQQFPKGFPPGAMAIAGEDYRAFPIPTFTSPKDFQDKKSEGILWGVPKRRRTAEKRLTRRFGVKEWVWKMLIPKYNLLVCNTCGHHYQAKHLCRNCYDKTAAETKFIRESVEAKLGHSPIDKDVIVLYESDKTAGMDVTPYTSQNKLIVELPKERPAFFSSNLLQKTTSGVNRKAKDITSTDPVPIVHKGTSE